MTPLRSRTLSALVLLGAFAACQPASPPQIPAESPAPPAPSVVEMQTIPLVPGYEPDAPDEPTDPDSPAPSISPKDPIAGEAIMAFVPHGPSTGPQDCTAGRIEVQPIRRGEVTVLHVALNQTGNCEALGGLTGVDLGQLPAGDYRIETRNFQRNFTVRPKGSDPGDLPPMALVQAAVAKDQNPGQCFGMPGPPPPDAFFPGDFTTSRTASLMRKAFPGESDQALERLWLRMRHILVGVRADLSWTYSYQNGQCCTIEHIEGVVLVAPDGSLSVQPPRVVDSKSVPC